MSLSLMSEPVSRMSSQYKKFIDLKNLRYSTNSILSTQFKQADDVQSKRSSREEYCVTLTMNKRNRRLTKFRSASSPSKAKKKTSPVKLKLSKIKEASADKSGNSNSNIKRNQQRQFDHSVSKNLANTEYITSNPFGAVPEKHEELGTAFNERMDKVEVVKKRIKKFKIIKVQDEMTAAIPEMQPTKKNIEQLAVQSLLALDTFFYQVAKVQGQFPLTHDDIVSLDYEVKKLTKPYHGRYKEIAKASKVQDLWFYNDLSEEERKEFSARLLELGNPITHKLQLFTLRSILGKAYRAAITATLTNEPTIFYDNKNLPKNVEKVREAILETEHEKRLYNQWCGVGCKIMFHSAPFPLKLWQSRYVGVELLSAMGASHDLVAYIKKYKMYMPTPNYLEHLFTEENRFTLVYFDNHTDKNMFFKLFKVLHPRLASSGYDANEKKNLNEHIDNQLLVDQERYERMKGSELVVVNRYVLGKEALKLETENREQTKLALAKEYHLRKSKKKEGKVKEN